MRERMRLIREKTLLERQDQLGNKARAEFALTTRYEVQLLQRLSVVLNDVNLYPEQRYGELALLCDIYGSDKGSLTDDPIQHPYAPLLPHTYTDIYEVLFQRNNMRYNAKAIFECGIGTNNPKIAGNMTKGGKPGASLRVWRDYFENANVLGADIDRDILFEEDRIKTGYLDQTNPELIANFFAQCGIDVFDVMIDDGLHTFIAAKCLFEHSIKYLSNDGFYVIEDLALHEMKKFFLYMRNKKQFIVKYLSMETPLNWNNNLIIIQKERSKIHKGDVCALL